MAYEGPADALGRVIVATGSSRTVGLLRLHDGEDAGFMRFSWAEWDALVAGVEADRPTSPPNVDERGRSS